MIVSSPSLRISSGRASLVVRNSTFTSERFSGITTTRATASLIFTEGAAWAAAPVVKEATETAAAPTETATAEPEPSGEPTPEPQPSTIEPAYTCTALCTLHMVELCNNDRTLWAQHGSHWESTRCGLRAPPRP